MADIATDTEIAPVSEPKSTVTDRFPTVFRPFQEFQDSTNRDACTDRFQTANDTRYWR